jgi:Ca2+-binding RTX toxin-like protein
MAWQFPQSTTQAGVVVNLDENGESVFIARDVYIACGSNQHTIFGTRVNHQVVVAGTVAGHFPMRIGNDPLANSGSTITIEQSGQVRSFGNEAIELLGTGKIVNHGLVTALTYHAVFFRSAGATGLSTLTNTGTIDAGSWGVHHDRDATDTLVVNNSGTISGALASYWSGDAAAAKDMITNSGKMIGDVVLGGNDDLYDGRLGTVQGSIFGGAGTDRLYAGAGNDRLHGEYGNDILNGGTGADGMTGGLGDDVFYADNAADKVFEATNQGTDTVLTSVTYALSAGQHVEILGATSPTGTGAINIAGNELAQRINGNNAANLLSGNGGNDTLFGYGGNDVLAGGLGNDTLTGGLGNDYFVFNTTLNALTNVDRIADFNMSADTIRLDNAVMSGLGTTLGTLTAGKFWKSTSGLAHDADDRIIYETDTGKLFYDANGKAGGGGILFATLAPNVVLTSADFQIV